MKKCFPLFILVTIVSFTGCERNIKKTTHKTITVDNVFERVRSHKFNPLNAENSMTMDRNLQEAGIADLDNDDWKVRLLAVRDLVQAGVNDVNNISKGLTDQSIHVKQVCAMALGILKAKDAIGALEQVVSTDENSMVRSQAVIALGQIESTHSLDLLRKKLKEDPSRDV